MKKWILKDSRPVFSSKYISIRENDYLMPDGSIGENFYLMERPDFVLIVATSQDGELLVETNYRPGAEDFLLELPAGWIEKDEDVIAAGSRELLEETGYKGEASYMGFFYLAPAYSAIKGHVVRIKNAKKISDTQTTPSEDPDLQLLPIIKIRELIKKNLIKEIGIVAALNLAFSD